ncbi:MAG: DmsE family decaheme c-type cytochrome [Xanthomonadales bacterium]|nr:DmsE family decaheme c-type cytochrome [Xanthomonadales bacterium]
MTGGSIAGRLLAATVALLALPGHPTDGAPALPAAVQECLQCHDEPHVVAILSGPHAVAADARTGFARLGCGSCHGPSDAHMQRPPRGQRRAAPDAPLRRDDPAAVNGACLECHRGEAGLHWPGSGHDIEALACTDCHRVHAAEDPVLAADGEFAVCTRCHGKVRSEALRPSAHPLLDGRIACSDCHAAHGGPGPGLLRATTINENCTTCHAQYRGPFLWEHPPAAEDCLSCHRPHGSVHAPLLVKRTPWLCQDCHLAQFHPSTALSGTGLPGDAPPSGSSSLLGRDCMNCHVHVHGSNHPSGAGSTR